MTEEPFILSDNTGSNYAHFAPGSLIEGLDEQGATAWGTGDVGVDTSDESIYNYQPLQLSEFPLEGYDLADPQLLEKLWGDIPTTDFSTGGDISGFVYDSTSLGQWPLEVSHTGNLPPVMENTNMGNIALVEGADASTAEIANNPASKPYAEACTDEYLDTSWPGQPSSNSTTKPAEQEKSSVPVVDRGGFMEELTTFLDENGSDDPVQGDKDDEVTADATEILAESPSPAPADSSEETATEEHDLNPEDDAADTGQQQANEVYVQYPWNMYNPAMQGFEPYLYQSAHAQGYIPYMPPPPQEVVPPGMHPNFRAPPPPSPSYPFAPPYGFPYGYPAPMVYYPPTPENSPITMYSTPVPMPMIGNMPGANTPTIGSGNFTQYPYTKAKAADKSKETSKTKGKVDLSFKVQVAPRSSSFSKSSSSKIKKNKSLAARGRESNLMMKKELLLTTAYGHVDQFETMGADPQQHTGVGNPDAKTSSRRGKDTVHMWAYIDEDGMKVYIMDRKMGLMARWSEGESMFLLWASEMRSQWGYDRVAENMVRFSTREGYPGCEKEEVRVKRQPGAVQTQFGRISRQGSRTLDLTDAKVKGWVDMFEVAHPLKT